jgi:4-hydroxy-tetrahydrodipicolinate reductase
VSAAIRLVVIGAGGRMGRSLLGLLPQFPALELVGAVVAPGSPDLGRSCAELAGLDAGAAAAPAALRASADLAALLQGARLAIDFSRAEASGANLQACVNARVPLLLGTTGLPETLQPELQQAARHIPLLVAANTSLAVTVLTDLVARAARALPGSFDVQISEAHHRHKRDAPSGTALALGAAAEAAGIRPAGAIGYAVTRGGDLVGEHTVHFIGAGEQLSLSHVASDRAVFARGALQAGLWLASQPPGRYRMQDLIAEK